MNTATTVSSSSSGSIRPSLAPSMVLSLLPTIVTTTSTSQTVSNLSLGQEQALALIPIFTGAISAWGSASLIYIIYKTPKRSHNCYNRLMFALSCSDFVSCTVLSLQVFLLPAATSTRIWAIGTDATCTAMGFFQQMSLTSILYSGMLSWMYLLTIRMGVTEDTLTRLYEPWMHLISIGYPLMGAILGVWMGLFQEVTIGSFCWFAGPEPSTLMAYLFGGVGGFLTFLAVIVNNLLVYCHLRKSLREQKEQEETNISVDMAGDLPNFMALRPLPRANRSANSNESNESAQSAQSSEGNTSAFSNEHGTEAQALDREELRDRQRERQRLKSIQERENARIRAVAYQAFFYVAAFLVAYLPTFILRPLSSALDLEADQEASMFWLLLLQAIFWPLQGLFNYLIYSRSPTSYLREIH